MKSNIGFFGGIFLALGILTALILVFLSVTQNNFDYAIWAVASLLSSLFSAAVCFWMNEVLEEIRKQTFHLQALRDKLK